MTHEIDLTTEKYFELLKNTGSFKVEINRERYKLGDTVIFYELSNQFARLRSGLKIARRIIAISPIYGQGRKIKQIRIFLAL